MRLRLGLGPLLYIVAVVLFVLSALDVSAGNLSKGDLLALGLAFFAAGHVVR